MVKQEYTGIVLAGGRSTRMGSDKGLIPWNGATLVENAVGTLNSLCKKILISTDSDHYSFLGHPVVQDRYKGCGPIAGIFSCLEHTDTDRNLVIPVDVPFITYEIYLDLLGKKGEYDIILPVDHSNWLQPLCSVFNISALPVMEEQIRTGIYGFTPLIKKAKVLKVPFQTGNEHYTEHTFLNINSPEDLEAFL